MKRFQIRWTIFAITFLVLFSYQNCAYVGQEQSTDMSSTDETSAASKSAVLERKAMAILRGRCYSCHNPSMPSGEFDSVTDINAMKYYRWVIPGEPQISRLYEVIAMGEMPPRPQQPLDQTQTQAIYDWILDGMKEDQAGVVPPGSVSQVVEPRWASLFANVIQPKCVGCHNGTRQDGGVNLSNYNAARNTVQPGNPNASSLYTSTSTARMPRGGVPLNGSQLTALRDWITNGAPNN